MRYVILVRISGEWIVDAPDDYTIGFRAGAPILLWRGNPCRVPYRVVGADFGNFSPEDQAITDSLIESTANKPVS